MPEIRIAQGAYRPDVGKNVLAGDRLASFEIGNGIALKGGYAGLALSDPNARDIAAYETILSGDLAGNDGPSFANAGGVPASLRRLRWDACSAKVVSA